MPGHSLLCSPSTLLIVQNFIMRAIPRRTYFSLKEIPRKTTNAPEVEEGFSLLSLSKLGPSSRLENTILEARDLWLREQRLAGSNHSPNLWGKVLVPLKITIKKSLLSLSYEKTISSPACVCRDLSHLWKGIQVFWIQIPCNLVSRRKEKTKREKYTRIPLASLK